MSFDFSRRRQFNNFYDSWHYLQPKIRRVLDHDLLDLGERLDCVELIEDMCKEWPDQQDVMYLSLRSILRSHMSELREDILRQKNELALFQTYHKHWVQYMFILNDMNAVFQYLNVNFVTPYHHGDINTARYPFRNVEVEDVDRDDQIMFVDELCLDVWKHELIMEVYDQLNQSLFKIIKKMLSFPHEDLDMKTVNRVLHSYIHVQKYSEPKYPHQFYAEIFEERFFNRMDLHYNQERDRLLLVTPFSAYVRKVMTLAQISRNRIEQIFPMRSHPYLRSQFEQAIVIGQWPFVSNELLGTFVAEDSDTLINMYWIMRPHPHEMTDMVNIFKEYVRIKFENDIIHLDPDHIHYGVRFIARLCFVYNIIQRTISTTFRDDDLFLNGLDSKFVELVSCRDDPLGPSVSANYFAQFFDFILKNDKYENVPGKLDGHIEAAVKCMRFMPQVDLFQQFYARLFAKRLVLKRSYSLETEEKVFTELSAFFTYSFIKRMKIMISECRDSNNRNRAFLRMLSFQKVELPFRFSTVVVRNFDWRAMTQPDRIQIVLPRDFEDALDRFNKYYIKDTNGNKKLCWCFNLCDSTMNLLYTDRQYAVTMSTYHTVIMYQFEFGGSRTFRDLLLLTGMSEEYLCRYMFSMIQAGLMISNFVLPEESADSCDSKEQKIPRYLHTTEFVLNKDFQHEELSFKLSVTQDGIREIRRSESLETFAWIEQDRRYFLQVAIIRAMKKFKIAHHNRLIDEVMSDKHLQFEPTRKSIEEAIELLMDVYIQNSRFLLRRYNYIEVAKNVVDQRLLRLYRPFRD